MQLDEKIKLYEEILDQDPNSKLFFPLAKIYVEKDELQRACEILERGLTTHPEHMEARLLLIELLSKQGRMDVAMMHLEKMETIFKTYSSFWNLWADYLASKGNKDVAGYVLLLGKFLGNGDGITIGEKLYDILCKDHKEYEKQTEVDDHLEEVSQDEESKVDLTTADIEFKTKTMADILMAQGDYKSAILIYKDLIKKEKDRNVKEELKAKLQEAEQKLNKVSYNKNIKQKDKRLIKRKLLNRLKILANRLEARA